DAVAHTGLPLVADAPPRADVGITGDADARRSGRAGRGFASSAGRNHAALRLLPASREARVRPPGSRGALPPREWRAPRPAQLGWRPVLRRLRIVTRHHRELCLSNGGR